MRGTVTLLGGHSFPCDAPALQPTEAASLTRRVTVGRSRRRPAPRWPYLCSGSRRPASQGRGAGSARRTEPRVQGSKRQLVLILPPSFPRLHAVPQAALGPGPLGPSWGSTSAAARPTGRRRDRPRAALGPRLRQMRLLQGRARCAQPAGDGRRLPGPQARPAPPVPGGGVGAGRDSFSSPQRRRRTAWRRRRRRRRRRWRRRRRRGRKVRRPARLRGAAVADPQRGAPSSSPPARGDGAGRRAAPRPAPRAAPRGPRPAGRVPAAARVPGVRAQLGGVRRPVRLHPQDPAHRRADGHLQGAAAAGESGGPRPGRCRAAAGAGARGRGRASGPGARALRAGRGRGRPTCARSKVSIWRRRRVLCVAAAAARAAAPEPAALRAGAGTAAAPRRAAGAGGPAGPGGRPRGVERRVPAPRAEGRSPPRPGPREGSPTAATSAGGGPAPRSRTRPRGRCAHLGAPGPRGLRGGWTAAAVGRRFNRRPRGGASPPPPPPPPAAGRPSRLPELAPRGHSGLLRGDPSGSAAGPPRSWDKFDNGDGPRAGKHRAG